MSVLKSDEQLETGEVWGHKRLVLSHAVNCMVGDEGWHETGLMTISRRLHSGSVCVCVIMFLGFQMQKETETASQQESGLPSAFLVSYQGR